MIKDLSEFIPWILVIFFVLFLIACCSWLYRCIQKCDDQCPGILPSRSPYNPNSPMTPFQSVRNTRNIEGTRRLTTRSATNDSNEPSGSCILSSSSAVHYHGQKAPPYVSFAERPPPPTYEEACSSGANVRTDNQESVAIVDTTNIDTDNTDTATVSTPEAAQIESAAAEESNPDNSNRGSRDDTVDVVNESVVIDNPQDEPLINADDDDDDLHDVVIETTTSDPPQPGT